MLQAERRRRSDRMVAAGLVVTVAIGIALIAVFSPAVHTTSVTAAEPPPVEPPPPDVPAALSEAWRAPSAATPVPAVNGPSVVTGDDSTVIGRDPVTGVPRWSYHRDLPLCTVGVAWDVAIAVYRNGDYCSEVTSLRPGTGVRGPQRNADVPPGTRLLASSDLVTATGANHLETWRSDLVKTLEYGAPRAELQPNSQPRPECVHGSVAAAEGRLRVLERCPGEPGDRLTVLRPDSNESEKPREESSTVLPGRDGRLVAMTGDRAAVLLPGPTRLSVRGIDGVELASYPLDLPASDLAGDPPGGLVPTVAVPGALLWWTGSRTVALDPADLGPRWSVPNTLGPGIELAGKPVVPGPDVLWVLDPTDGRVARTVPVPRGDFRGPVTLGALGPMIFEQRGPTLVALR